MNYSIRELKRDENKILDTFLYEAIFIPEGVPAPSKDIINKPDLQVSVQDFGENKGDLCLVAQVADEIVGAVWVRIMNDYGHIDNETPSFAISLLKEYRNYGIGTELMKQMLVKLKLEGYKQASLAVQKMNYAVRMYWKVGFEIIDENDEEYIMICKLQELSTPSLSDSQQFNIKLIQALQPIKVKVLFLRLERRWLKHTTSGKARFNHYNRNCLIIQSYF